MNDNMIFQDYDPIPANEQLPEMCDCVVQRRYAAVLKKQLIRMFGTPPEGSRYETRFNDHDFGGYITLRLSVPRTNEGIEYFHKVDTEFPIKWDKESLRQLKLGEWK